MTTEELIAQVPGTSELIAHFGYWPSFHDAQVLGIDLQRGDVSKLKLYLFRLPGEIDLEGYYVMDRHTLVTFLLEGVSNTNLTGFNSGNVLFGMTVQKSGEEFELVLESTYGVEGSIVAKRMEIEFLPVAEAVSADHDAEMEAEPAAPTIIN